MQPAYRDTALLFSRAGFGGLHREVEAHQDVSWSTKVDLVLDLSRAPAESNLPNLAEDRDWYDKYVDMVHFWLDRARRPVTEAPIQEKMVLFWHGLLCSGLEKVSDHAMIFDQHRLFRRLGFGNVEKLLWEASIGPAMLRYLDNDQNFAGEINENFARELMELFTIGVGNFSESDVRAAARAWTGHGLDKQGRYRYSPEEHDNGTKTFLGQTGRWNGRDIISLLVTQRREEHARFFCHKLWSFFAYPVSPNDAAVTDIMATYRRSLNVQATVRAIFLHPDFRSTKSLNGRMRSPIEYAVASMRHTKLDCGTAHPEWYLSTMGQEPFEPPNVAGWKHNDYWISESAVWAKGKMASHLRWRVFERDDLRQVNDITDWDTRTYRITPEQAVEAVMNNYQMRLRSPNTRQTLINYIATERRSDDPWGQRAGILMLPLLTPEFQLA